MTAKSLYEKVLPLLHTENVKSLASGNYQIDLSLNSHLKDEVPAYVWPRLPANQDKSVNVPLYSDLKLHFMGKRLADNYPQPTDTDGYAAQPGIYVTRPLWGVADTAPYIHDDRARTLRDAIELHGVAGSEAEKAYEEFSDLNSRKQQDLINFLESLKLHIQEGIEAPEYLN